MCLKSKDLYLHINVFTFHINQWMFFTVHATKIFYSDSCDNIIPWFNPSQIFYQCDYISLNKLGCTEGSHLSRNRSLNSFRWPPLSVFEIKIKIIIESIFSSPSFYHYLMNFRCWDWWKMSSNVCWNQILLTCCI